jgi:hypothetical protein
MADDRIDMGMINLPIFTTDVAGRILKMNESCKSTLSALGLTSADIPEMLVDLPTISKARRRDRARWDSRTRTARPGRTARAPGWPRHPISSPRLPTPLPATVPRRRRRSTASCSPPR